MRRAAWLAAVVTSLPGPLWAKTIQALYTCERGVEIPVVYVNDAAGGNAAILWAEGRLTTLMQARSASGARYTQSHRAAGDEIPKSGCVWWSRGDTAMLAWFDAQGDEEVVLFAACVAG